MLLSQNFDKIVQKRVRVVERLNVEIAWGGAKSQFDMKNFNVI